MILFGLLLTACIYFLIYGSYILVISFTVWMAVDAAKQDRFWWTTLVIGLPVIGAAAYYFTEKKHEYAKAIPHHIHESLTEKQHESSPKKKSTRKVKVETKSEVKEDPAQEVVSKQE